jgi:hypothetical protein
MNYFQRPAEETGESIRVRPRDAAEAANVVVKVVAALKPQLVVAFASRLGWRHAKAGLAEQLKAIGIQTLIFLIQPRCGETAPRAH